jgi:hypothetical protein
MPFVIERHTLLEGWVPTVFDDELEVIFPTRTAAGDEVRDMLTDEPGVSVELRVREVPASFHPRTAR